MQPTSIELRRSRRRNNRSAAARQKSIKHGLSEQHKHRSLSVNARKRTLSQGDTSVIVPMGVATAPPFDDFLPRGWTGAIDKDDNTWYINKDTGMAQLNFPLPEGWSFADDGAFINEKGVKLTAYPIFGGNKFMNRRM